MLFCNGRNIYKLCYRNRRATMQSKILEETQAFITRQRDALLAQREAIFSQQAELQKQLDELNGMLSKFDVFEGKRAAQSSTRTRRSSTSRRGSKREELVRVVREGNGLSRGE